MPVKEMSRKPSPQAEELRELLAREWRKPAKSGEPVILQRTGDATHSTHLIVVWAKWDSLTQEERSEIIMDAYQETHSPEQVLNVTVAMGLTPDEAEKMKIAYK